MIDEQKLKALIALLATPGVGNITAKSLISYCGSINAVFKAPKSKLKNIPGIGHVTADEIVKKKYFDFAEKEIEFVKKHKIKILDYWDENFPYRLKNIPDAPTLLYSKGNFNLNQAKVLAVVGTRKCTDYGKLVLEKIIKDLSQFDDLVIVSGLAYGIDKTAHVESLNRGIENVAILGHGLQTIYPAQHRGLASKICENGGLLTEFTSQSIVDPSNFPKRNRIIAGVCDALLVVETGIKGGSMVSAELAHSYNREIMAIPGRVGDKVSEGCNRLIKINKAILVESTADIIYNLSWDVAKPKQKQQKLFVELNEIETKVYNAFAEKPDLHIEEIIKLTQLNLGSLSANLLGLEIKGLIKSVPGNIYKLI